MLFILLRVPFVETLDVRRAQLLPPPPPVLLSENYCSSACQIESWPTHKLSCRAPLPPTSRIWVIHPRGYAAGHSDDPLASRESIKAHLQAWDMKEGVFGNESKEKEAIKKKFKWTGVDEGGKTYNKAGVSLVQVDETKHDAS